MDKPALLPERDFPRQEQRRTPRVVETFPATLVPLRGPFGLRRVHGEVRDFHDQAACVKASRMIPVGRKVKVRLRIPWNVSRFYRGLPCEIGARVTSVRKVQVDGETAFSIIIRWDRPLTRSVRGVIASYRRKIGLLIVCSLLAVLLVERQGLTFYWYDPLFYVYSLGLLGFLLSRFVLSWMHSSPKLSRDFLPSLSVVVAVRNEEKNIAKGVQTCLEADYPKELREVIVVNDGSTDGTAEILEKLAARYSDLRVFTLSPSGKRRAMAEGVLRARGDIIVFVDSDTFLAPDALREIVSGFEDPALGAVSGYTGVANADKNSLTGLQEVRYHVSFQLLKTAESFFGCVTCCPGCLSAYRRRYVLEILDAWLNQRFLGASATFGDDRSLTNFILRKYRVVYNERAVAYTMVPETWRHYLRQQVRWKKSWLRETFLASRFFVRKGPLAAFSFYAAAIFSLLSPVMSFRVIFHELRFGDGFFLYYLLGLILLGLLQSFYFLYKRPSPHWLLGILWMASSLFVTGPQTYYALLTLRKNHWGTR